MKKEVVFARQTLGWIIATAAKSQDSLAGAEGQRHLSLTPRDVAGSDGSSWGLKEQVPSQALWRERDAGYLEGCWPLMLTPMSCRSDMGPPTSRDTLSTLPGLHPPNHQLTDANTCGPEQANPRSPLSPSGDTVESHTVKQSGP